MAGTLTPYALATASLQGSNSLTLTNGFTALVPATVAAGFGASSTPAVGVNVVAFFDGEERARIFDNSVSWPTLSNLQYVGSSVSLVGQILLSVTYAAGSTDSGSPANFILDPLAVILVSSATQ